MKRLDEKNPLFDKLRHGNYIWWENIKRDKDLSIHVRKNNHIDVYYNGGAILRNLSLSKRGDFQGAIHNEYIPLKESSYKQYEIDLNIGFKQSGLKTDSIDNFSKEKLKGIKNKISNHFGKTSEKGIQFTFIKKDPYFIDAEIMDTYEGKNGKECTIRIDLVRLDVIAKKIVFIEVKTIGDSRLYSTGKDNIEEQLENYKEYLLKNKKILKAYYIKMYEIKHNLGILPEGLISEIDNIDRYQIETKPLLLFGDCKQRWIDNNSSMLYNRIHKIAFGCYYFGKPCYDCSLLKKTKGNRHIYG